MADERSQSDRARSEQQESLEWRQDTGEDRGRHRATTMAGPQYTAPNGGGAFIDDEALAIADEAGSSYPIGPEDQAMHIETIETTENTEDIEDAEDTEDQDRG